MTVVAQQLQLPDGLPTPRRYFAMLAISLGNILAVIDMGIANVALPTIARELNVNSNDAVLVVTVYQLVLVMTVLPLAALGDRLGHRRVYQIGQLIFTAASFLCFFAKDLHTLLIVRAIQALGGGALLSVSTALLRSIYPAEQIGRGLGLNAVVIATGLVIAPPLGGLILSVAPWQWVFVAAVPFGLASLFIGRSALPRPRQYSDLFDLKGSVLSALTFGLLIIGLEGLAHGQPLYLSTLEILCGAVLAIFFVRGQLRSPRPIMPVELLAKPMIAMSFLANFAAHMAQMCVMVSMPFRLQHGYGFSPAETGAMISPWPFTVMIVAPLSGYLSDRIPASLLGGIGMAFAASGLAALSFLPAHPDAFDIGWRMVLCGLGFGMFFSPNARLLVSATPRDRMAALGGMIATTRLVAQTLGASLVAGILALNLGDGGLATMIACGLVVIACIISAARLRQPAPGVSKTAVIDEF